MTPFSEIKKYKKHTRPIRGISWLHPGCPVFPLFMTVSLSASICRLWSPSFQGGKEEGGGAETMICLSRLDDMPLLMNGIKPMQRQILSIQVVYYTWTHYYNRDKIIDCNFVLRMFAGYLLPTGTIACVVVLLYVVVVVQ